MVLYCPLIGNVTFLYASFTFIISYRISGFIKDIYTSHIFRANAKSYMQIFKKLKYMDLNVSTFPILSLQ